MNNTPPAVAGKKRPPSRAAAQKAAKKTKRVADEDSDEDMEDIDEDDQEDEDGDEEDALKAGNGEDESAASPSKLTARQRARGNVDLQETLIALPMGASPFHLVWREVLIADPGNKKLVLTEAEKLQRREEVARRRKRQSEQKLQDEQVCLSPLTL